MICVLDRVDLEPAEEHFHSVAIDLYGSYTEYEIIIKA